MATKILELAPFLKDKFKLVDATCTAEGAVRTKHGVLFVDDPQALADHLAKVEKKGGLALQHLFKRYRCPGYTDMQALATAVDFMIIPEPDGIVVYSLSGHWEVIHQ